MNKVYCIKNTNYTTLSNEFFRNEKLSLKAKGLLALVLTLPQDWNFTIKGICSIIKESTTCVYNTIKELKQFGYCTIGRIRDEKGKIIGTDYTFFESPDLAAHNAKKPHMENPHMDNPHMENVIQQNKDINNTSISLNKNNNIKQEKIKQNKEKREKEIIKEKEIFSCDNVKNQPHLYSTTSAKQPKVAEKKTPYKRFVKPTVDDIKQYVEEKGYHIDANAFFDFYESKGWVVGKSPMKDWHAACRTWERKYKERNADTKYMKLDKEALEEIEEFTKQQKEKGDLSAW